jgi:single-strand DNA-binding protein
MNSFNAIGNIGNDAELRQTKEGTAILSWSIAVNYGYGKNAISTWVRCSLFGKRAESLQQYMLKGTMVGIQGEIALQTYTNKQGEVKSDLICNVSNVTLCGKKEANRIEAPTQPKSAGELPSDFEDDIPF